MEITALLLAGGLSKRMGKDKAFLIYKGKTFLRNILESVQPYVDEIILSINKSEDLYLKELKGINKKIKFVKDRDIYGGPLNAIVSCAPEINTKYFFLLTVDTPLFKGELIPFLKDKISDYDCVIPVVNGKYQPLNTIYNSKSLSIANQVYAVEKKDAIFDWVKRLNIKYIYDDELRKIDKNLGSYFSVNTPYNYETLLKCYND